MIDQLTPVLQNGANLAIELNTKFFGIQCQIFYPIDTGSYSGKHDDIDYRETPDDEQVLLIPQIYDTRRTPLAGLNDSLFTDYFTLYVKHDFNLPYLSKIIATSEKLGTFQFIVDNQDSVSTFSDRIYREVILTPFMDFSDAPTEVVENLEKLSEEYENDVLTDKQSTIDNSISNSVSDAERVKYKFRKME